MRIFSLPILLLALFQTMPAAAEGGGDRVIARIEQQTKAPQVAHQSSEASDERHC
ncbi:co-regulatory protein PtrA N-terminal domain-containing protein [Pseudomonas sp. PIC25]|uniref:co-regulatory protein PtrA N-terminal domain-containing protein n=1 Tax=Pseudomonas sp. PIC25 TaxID=1958773 RepID=UPI00143D6060|nr:co-regulatory protein PtrA N-terminal domain-containing protein [Pseudomonas sp. PIC25]